jgi:DNA processing protein
MDAGKWHRRKTIRAVDVDEALKRAEEELKFISKNNIDVIFYTDTRYPKRLKNCNDSPVLLYAKGNADLNAQHVISIVGTRKPPITANSFAGN